MALTVHVAPAAVVPRVERVRVTLRCPGRGAGFVDEHVRVALPAPEGWARLGDVLHEESAAPGRAEWLASRYPGALVVAVSDGEACRLRVGACGREVLLRAGPCGVPPWPVIASLAHAFAGAGGGWFSATAAADVSHPPTRSQPTGW
ncbi:hypothetical protein [Streptomyces flavofungini]|uniref:hypothetical protein n=1 Tax=Streptomyces flavofungini TaxID=68200 RepID=UPI0025B16405|nr:hypothetical protein [Streptomyces flavofungini]WJV45527.1 hypothetical protein QUY26_08260 [Streptomyces flavofungini]